METTWRNRGELLFNIQNLYDLICMELQLSSTYYLRGFGRYAMAYESCFFNPTPKLVTRLFMISHLIFLPTYQQISFTDLFDSNGHGCMLQYALLHLAGYALSMDDLKKFRVRRY